MSFKDRIILWVIRRKVEKMGGLNILSKLFPSSNDPNSTSMKFKLVLAAGLVVVLEQFFGFNHDSAIGLLQILGLAVGGTAVRDAAKAYANGKNGK